MLNKRQFEASKLLNNVNEIPAPVKDHILYVVNGMVGNSNLFVEDMKDAIMEIAEEVLMARQKVEETGGTITNAYLNQVADNTRNQIYRKRGRLKRALDKRMISLNVTMSDDAPDALTMDRLECEEAAEPDFGSIECAEIRVLVDGLPKPLKSICLLYMAGRNFQQIAAELHISHVTVRTHYWPKLKTYFMKAGFGR